MRVDPAAVLADAAEGETEGVADGFRFVRRLRHIDDKTDPLPAVEQGLLGFLLGGVEQADEEGDEGEDGQLGDVVRTVDDEGERWIQEEKSGDDDAQDGRQQTRAESAIEGAAHHRGNVEDDDPLGEEGLQAEGQEGAGPRQSNGHGIA